ncbi:protein of unknown function DUF303 acetylesterase putative [Fibrisoma limi BUZ 3]|uniref:Fibronectin type-III domain-containing protein n=1 Tax=Fibrisoma limi BUZ 3 TaxID=1185876 RepID=I2GFV5_9BACT|nr:sialate O-acetylesterase [Fibrisoma limi]CCH52780.1 protein of unknown function DUF303 acetylesterase putative [Fibrisoma limi BUZ 3]
MKLLYASVLLFLFNFPAKGQVTFENLPKDLQLYPRNAANQAEVIVNGKVTATGFQKIGMQVFREGALSAVVSQTLSPTATNVDFRLPTTIKAERAQYGFKVFLYKGTDSTLVAERNRVVCGDVILLHGQSNALALAGLDEAYSFNFDDTYLRNCTYPYGSLNIPGEMMWYSAKNPYASVGGFGLTLQKLILDTYGIPTCIISEAIGGTGIDVLTFRNPANHADLQTAYGRLLYRARWAGAEKQIKAIIWKQGENEAGNKPDNYPALFKTFYDQLREDYNDAKIYVGQINILADRVDAAAGLRDFQRRTGQLFRNVEAVATVGTMNMGNDGIHFGVKGHQQLAFEQFRLLARDVYGSADTAQVSSPDIKKVFYNARKDSITLVFNEGMQMIWPQDTAFYNFATKTKVYSRSLKDYVYLDGKAGDVTGGVASGNRILIGLKQPSSAKAIRYLPAYFSDQYSNFYDGPTLRNTRGMRALTFDNVAIADLISAVSTLAAKPISEKQIQLNWTAPAGAQRIVLERSNGSPNSFTTIATLSGTTATYADANLPDPLGTYYYRLRAFSDVSESPYSNVISARPLVLGVEPIAPVVRLYPNPLAADRTLRIEADQTTFTSLTIRDELGRAVKVWNGRVANSLTVSLDELEAGFYIADLQTSDQRTLRRKVVVR